MLPSLNELTNCRSNSGCGLLEHFVIEVAKILEIEQWTTFLIVCIFDRDKPKASVIV